MNTIAQARPLAVALTLAGGVLVLCSARPPLAVHHNLHASERPGARVLRVYEQHQRRLRDSIVSLALAQVGTPYKRGGTTPDGFDCSGFVQYVYGRLYLMPPRLAAHQARIGALIRRDNLRPGDILAFGAADSVTHVGLYVGDRKFVHASSVAGRVIVSSIDRPPSELIRPLKLGRRVLAMAN
jgi:cell wall-associated NlpC family hydrolase